MTEDGLIVRIFPQCAGLMDSEELVFLRRGSRIQSSISDVSILAGNAEAS